jgi:hypothetical protein
MQDDPLSGRGASGVPWANAFCHENLGQLPGDRGDYVIRRCD